ncbi:cation-translocating P-type ATPase [Mycoplasma leonicaptivi]|uniref:cation-translocating P-type ATPase n=1 Tax=Mycoplasma leonicaptivi TaxID=36742 RepID=UPI000487699D|nr:cation-translocating P-type ATPase [Mycoplasma leonicaptivi]
MKNQDYIKNKTGLTQKQSQDLLNKHGENIIHSEKQKSIIAIFFNQFKDFMIILLLIAAAFSLGVAFYETFGSREKPETSEIIVSFIEPIIILIVIVLNSMLGTYQEIKSNQAVKALEKNNELMVKVIRDNKTQYIPSNKLVPGDLIIVEAGDAICADSLLLESFSLQVVESALTGESVAVDKNSDDIIYDPNTPLGERKSEIFSGTYVTNGRAIALVLKTGQNTEIGKINSLIQEQEVQLTPLQIKLNKLSKIFGILGVTLLFITTLSQLILTNTVFGGNWNNPETYSNSVIIGISLAVAAIPEGLITFTTVLLAIGVSKMTKENVIIKAFPVIETLGSTSIICSDKTGTLTENKMTVVKFFDVNNSSNIADSLALYGLVGCCDAKISKDENNNIIEIGDPTETGILRYGLDNNLTEETFNKEYQKLYSLPFDSERKCMSILVKNKNDEYFIFTKGAPDVILSKSKNQNNEYMHIVEEWSNNAYRVIAIAYKKLLVPKNQIDLPDEQDLEFLGLIGMIDPARSGVKESIYQAKQAGIKPIMITGDHITTAVAIAKELGIYSDNDIALTGYELAKISDEELKERVKHISVYARVNPSDKLRIVKAWQQNHQVVAMTGDGVNDAPALKASDIGVAMGITGTDVSKQAADVILTDDNFTTIVKAIKRGRETFDRIKSVILNLLVSSLTEIIVMLFGLFVLSFVFKNQIKNQQLIILSASQLLWINLLTHGLPAIALGMTPNDSDVMKRNPFKKSESIFARGMGTQLIIQSVVLSLISIFSYLFVGIIASKNNVDSDNFIKLTSTAMFTTLGIGASLNSINLMSSKSLFLCNLKKYKLVYLASLSSFACVLIAAFVPGISDIFKMASISKITNYNNLYWIIPIVLGFGLIFYNELEKLSKNLFKKYIK